jgi:hypothetical protein
MTRRPEIGMRIEHWDACITVEELRLPKGLHPDWVNTKDVGSGKIKIKKSARIDRAEIDEHGVLIYA